MPIKVDTFEKDIADEIKRKDASLSDIASARKDVGDDTPLPKQIPPILIVLVGTAVFAILGIVGLGYYYFTNPLLPPSQEPVSISPEDAPKKNTELSKISETLNNEIGTYVSSVEKRDQGYVITITNYTAVFSYMARNENSYINDLSALFAPSTKSFETTSTENAGTNIATSTTSLTTSSTSVSTSTKPKVISNEGKTGTSTKTKIATSSGNDVSTTSQSLPSFTQKHEITNVHFSDITIANQNMRVWVSGNHRVVYSFLGTTKVLISNSPEGIIALRGAILR